MYYSRKRSMIDFFIIKVFKKYGTSQGFVLCLTVFDYFLKSKFCKDYLQAIILLITRIIGIQDCLHVTHYYFNFVKGLIPLWVKHIVGILLYTNMLWQYLSVSCFIWQQKKCTVHKQGMFVCIQNERRELTLCGLLIQINCPFVVWIIVE